METSQKHRQRQMLQSLGNLTQQEEKSSCHVQLFEKYHLSFEQLNYQLAICVLFSTNTVKFFALLDHNTNKTCL